MNRAQDRLTSHFHSLHDPASPLVLANVWDVASASVAERAGAPAIATTSAGLAWSLGRPDGNNLDRALVIPVISSIARAVSVPVTVDLECGYGRDNAEVADTVRAVLDAGVSGINIEDGALDPDMFAQRLESARSAAEHHGTPLFINARVDVYLMGTGSLDERLTEARRRAALYLSAGADGVFFPGVSDRESISWLVGSVEAPVNIMAGPGSLNVAELGALGVARVSLGSAVAQAAYAVVERATRELLSLGEYSAVSAGLDYEELNAAFSR